MLGLLITLWRGPRRALLHSDCLAWGYLSSRAWAMGENPYSVVAAENTLPLDAPSGFGLDGIPTPYAPGFFAVFSFYKWLDWRGATIVNLTLSVLGIAGAFVYLARQLNLSRDKQWLLIALGVLGYPLGTGMQSGQPSVLAIACALAMLAASLANHSAWWVALLAASSLLFKPQVGVGCFLFLLLCRNWAAVFRGTLLFAFVNLAGVLWMMAHGANLETFGGAIEGIAQVNAQQSDPFCCVNLQATRIPTWIQAVLLAIPAVGAFRLFRSKAGEDEVLSLDGRLTEELRRYGVAMSCALLAVYQRPYNLLVLFPLVWFVVRDTSGKQTRWLFFLLLFSVIQPVPLLPLARLVEEHLPSVIRSMHHALARPLQSWLLLGVLYLLVYAPRLCEPAVPVPPHRGDELG